ncbi:MOB kinase activator 1A [Thelohanellus kitauei]|uniref:MOB kinase activator 1A n=1 Tax=Thelohanellus kitauei TaxID=669202 RepID=A0A0C2M917_THEKT|nr:MOB kinase activator 1A [Thelohanellus kitauei]
MTMAGDGTMEIQNMQDAVRLPEGEDISEWLAEKLFDFYNQTRALYKSLEGRCTEEKCPVMCAGKKYEYKWSDKTTKTPLKLSAPKYIEKLMEWIQDQLDDGAVFPPTKDIPFPKNFLSIVKNIFRRLFRVYAHIYNDHLKDVQELQEEYILSASFKHFTFFVLEFKLIEDKELKPLEKIIGMNVAGTKHFEVDKS